jgi:hypothetical protein
MAPAVPHHRPAGELVSRPSEPIPQLKSIRGLQPIICGDLITRRAVLRGALASAVTAVAGPLFPRQPSPFDGRNAGEGRVVDELELRWCPPGRFVMGSPPSEPERRPGEDQVEAVGRRGNRDSEM